MLVVRVFWPASCDEGFPQNRLGLLYAVLLALWLYPWDGESSHNGVEESRLLIDLASSRIPRPRVMRQDEEDETRWLLDKSGVAMDGPRRKKPCLTARGDPVCAEPRFCTGQPYQGRWPLSAWTRKAEDESGV